MLTGLLAIFRRTYIIIVVSEFFREILRKGESTKMLFAPKEKGQGLVEYALILVLVAIVVIAALMILGPIIGNTFSTINKSLNSV